MIVPKRNPENEKQFQVGFNSMIPRCLRVQIVHTIFTCVIPLGITVWRHLWQTSRSTTALFTRVLTNWQTTCQIPMKVLTLSGISSPTTMNHSRKRVACSINCEELAAASAGVGLDQPPVPPTSGPRTQQELDWCVFVCVGICLIDKSTHWTWMRISCFLSHNVI